MNPHIKFQQKTALVGLLLFILKLLAWTYTNSDAVFSDAMESIVNVLSAFIGLYALYLAAKPRDENHPYGHGKADGRNAQTGCAIEWAHKQPQRLARTHGDGQNACRRQGDEHHVRAANGLYQ